MIHVVKGRFPIFLAVGGVIGLSALAGAFLAILISTMSPAVFEEIYGPGFNETGISDPAKSRQLTEAVSSLNEDLTTLLPISAAMMAVMGALAIAIGIGLDLWRGNLTMNTGAVGKTAVIRKSP
ncbi:MAG: hypothetical protein QW568_00035 [Candidatus Anstonellaceae archaeon]